MTASELLVTLVGWIALLLWGVRMVRTGITRSFTGQVRGLLATAGRHRLSAAGIGFAVTIVLQSATATGLIAASLVSREIMTLGTALALVLGADVGSTIAAFLFSFNLSFLPPLLLACGVLLFLASRGERKRSLGRILIGLGLTLLSLRLIGAASGELRQSPGFIAVMSFLEAQPVLAMLVATALTWLAHSSLSMVILVMSMAVSGVVSLPLALVLVLGANAGASLAPYVDQLAGPPAARRVALGNLMMRGSMVVVVLLLFVPLAARLLGGIFAVTPGHAILIFHVAFNLMAAAVFLPFADTVASLCRSLLPDLPTAKDGGEPRYLDSNALAQPTEALACATREALALGDLVATMLDQSLEVFETDDGRLLKQIEKSDNVVDRLHEAIKLYLIKVSSKGMSNQDSRRFVEILTFVTNLEHIGDIIDKNLMELAAKKIRNKLTFSRAGLDELRQIHARVRDNMRLAFNVFTLRDVRLARKLVQEKPLVREAEISSSNSHFARLRAGVPQSIETSSIHLDIIRDLKRINSHLTSVSYPILEEAGELLVSRLRDPDGQDGGTIQPT